MPFRQQKSRKKETAPAAQAALMYEGFAPINRPESDVRVDPLAVLLLVLTGIVLYGALAVSTDLAAGPADPASPSHAADASAASQSPEGVAR